LVSVALGVWVGLSLRNAALAERSWILFSLEVTAPKTSLSCSSMLFLGGVEPLAELKKEGISDFPSSSGLFFLILLLVSSSRFARETVAVRVANRGGTLAEP